MAPVLEKFVLPSDPIFGLPGEGNLLAWGAADGIDPELIARYARFAEGTGTRLTFLLNGSYPGWSVHATLLTPFVESGHVQLADHTWSHARLTTLSNTAIVSSIGYTSPVMGYGSLADFGLISADEIVRLAQERYLPQHIIIGHLNHLPVTEVFPQLINIVDERGLATVSLNNVFTA